MRFFLRITSISIFFLACFGLFHRALAADFEVLVNRIYTIKPGDIVEVEETRTVTNNSSTQIISSNNHEVFQIMVLSDQTDKLSESYLSATAYVDGTIRQYTGEAMDRKYNLSLPYESSVGVGGSKEFKIIYTNYGLTEHQGALMDVYVPGFVADFEFDDGQTRVTYVTKVRISDELPKLNFIAPIPEQKQKIAGYVEYTIPQESLLGNTLWIQFGRTQYYKFEIKQMAPATTATNKGYFNRYSVILPKDIEEVEITQQVFFSEISPELLYVSEDEEGNLIGTFEVPSHEDVEIIVKGYAKVTRKGPQIDSENSGELSDIVGFEKYLGEAQYWEVNHPEIQKVAQELRDDEENIYNIVAKTYQYVVDNIDYSEVKRFGINERQGALETLNGGAAVCMEYSDLFLTLLRAQGVPARAAFGYGYDSKLNEQEQDAHQWVEVYIPGLREWISVDVTWGESGPALIGGDLNHFYTHLAALSPDDPSYVERVSYGTDLELSAPEFEISAVAEIPTSVAKITGEQLLTQYPKSETTKLQALFDDLVYKIQTSNVNERIKDHAEIVVIAGAALIGISAIVFLKMIFDLIFPKKHESQTSVQDFEKIA